jgi:hypothetical protein
MRMTIHVDEQLLMQAKAQAATLGVTLAPLIADALRASLMRCGHVEHRGRVRLTALQGTGTRPGALAQQGVRPLVPATRSGRAVARAASRRC